MPNNKSFDKKYPKGSEWRKWDLHIHTPLSIYQGYGKNDNETWVKFIEDLEILPVDFSVLGINDYLFLDGYIKLKQEQDINGKLLKFKLLPVVEFRIEKFAGIDFGQLKRINLHVIFSDELTVETIQSQFLNTLEQSYFLENGSPWTRAITRESVEELGKQIKESIPASELHKYGSDLTEGFNNLNVKEDKIFESLNKDCFKGKYLIAIGKTEWSELKWTDNSIATKKSIINRADIVFTASNSVEEFHKAKAKLTQQGVNDILLDCSDSHYFSSSTNKDRIGNCYSWIKSDPTFEGLKQITFEPEERIRIQEINPDKDFDKPLFTSIQIIDTTKILDDENSNLHFTKTHIPLNSGLISIIGGRGQGKSMLINYLGHGFGKAISEKLLSKIKLDDNFQICWQQGSEAAIKIYSLGTQKDLPFTFIYQSKVKEIVDDNEVLKKEIIDIFSGAGFQKPINKIDEIQVKEVIQKYWNIKEWLEQKDDKGKIINDKESIGERIEGIKGKINLVTEGSNKLLLEEYVQNIEVINQKKDDNLRLKKLRKSIIDFRDKINIDISYFDSIPPIDTTNQQKQIATIYKRHLQMIVEYEVKNQRIKDENFKDYKGDLSQLLSNLASYQGEIKELEEQVKLLDENLIDLQSAKKKLDEIIVEQLKSLQDEASAITETWNKKIFDNPERGKSENELIKKILADKNIKIEGTIFFNINAFYFFAEKNIDGRSLKPKSKEKIFELLDIDKDTANDVLNYTIEQLEVIRNDNPGCFYEGNENDIFKIFIDPGVRNRYVQVIAEITVDGKNLSELSAGQKGTVYLCLKLATQLFSGPIIFDQPEDDLDNDFITNHLIDLFKEIKKYRQVIIVSHNANLVVNSDSEQIIIANNTNEFLSYESGSLENEKTNNDICRILEGGRRAFEKRREKYRFPIE